MLYRYRRDSVPLQKDRILRIVHFPIYHPPHIYLSANQHHRHQNPLFSTKNIKKKLQSCRSKKFVVSLPQISLVDRFMTFDRVIEDGRLWAVKYKGEKINALQQVLAQWKDADWLADFFMQNFDDLMTYFKVTDIEEAIYQTMDDRDELACIIMDISPDADLDRFFRPLDNNRTSEMILGKEKGPIKLTHTMQERQHTLLELEKMEKVRNFLISEKIFDDDSFTDYQQEIEP